MPLNASPRVFKREPLQLAEVVRYGNAGELVILERQLSAPFATREANPAS